MWGYTIVMNIRRASAVIAATLLAVGVAAPAAHAAPKSKPSGSTVTVVSMPPPTIRADRQDPMPTVIIQGVSKTTPVTVNWGDGYTSTERTKCDPKVAAKQPAKCTITATHVYSSDGTFTIAATVGKTALPTHTLTIQPTPVAWRPQAGFAQPANWAILNGGATYLPCSTVQWYWDRAGEPADRTLLHDDVQPALDMLARETGLKFVETSDPAAAQLTFRWGVDPAYPNAAGTGGGRWNGNSARVTLNPTNWWTEDKWRGFSVVNQPDGWYGNGNGWLLIHEVMHGLGLGHVNDESQVMNPINTVTGFGAGDLDGLHTMYLNQPCPAP